MKCRIHVLGAPGILTPAGQLATTKPLVFGAVLYLGLNRGEAIHRTHLSALLWPDADEVTRGGRSRWLVHQLRDVGLIAQARSPEVGFEMQDVALDVDDLTKATSTAEALGLVRGGVLAGYDPRISDTFSRWVDESRDALRSTVIGVLDRWLSTARRSGSWTEVEGIARRILAFDEFHERASLGLVEALAMHGRHDAAMQVLDRYRVTAGTEAGRSAARQLRDRLAEGSTAEMKPAGRTPLAGRKDVLALLLDSVSTGRSTSRRIGLAGPSGIGKSRLLDELTAVAPLRGARVAVVQCGRADSLRPLSLAADLARELLEVRGALGADPKSIETLRGFLGEGTAIGEDVSNEARRAAVFAALSDLVGALTDDGSLAVVIDDAQWAEPGSWAILAPLFSQQTTASLAWIVAVRSESQDTVGQTFNAIFPIDGALADQDRDVVWLAPITGDEIVALCGARAQPRSIPADVLAALVPRAAGIPFIAEALVDHWMEGGDIASLPPSVARLVSARLDRLSTKGTCVLESVAVLGPDASLSGLESVCRIERAGMLDATRELETAGILRADDGRFSAHALWTEAVLKRAPRTTLQVLHLYAAQWLEGGSAVPTSTDHRRHWAIASHWLDAGDPERARRALDVAAGILSDNGFLAEAAAMLERCAELAGVTETTLHYWERAAALWMQEHSSSAFDAVERIHAQYDRVGRALDPSFSLHHEVEALALLALGNQRGYSPSTIRQLAACTSASDASLTHRVSAAARIIARFARSLTDRAVADATWHAVEALVPTAPREHFEAELCAAHYFVRVADEPSRGVAHAERALATLSGDEQFDGNDLRRVMLALADSLEDAGDYDRAQATRREFLERARKSRRRAMMTLALESLIGAALEAGRLDEVRPLLGPFGRPSSDAGVQLDRARTIHWVVFALEEGDAERARADLDFPVEEADRAPGAMPRARILAIFAHLALLENDDAMAQRLLPLLLDCFAGRMSFMHHPAYVAAMCLNRYRGEESARDFVRRFIDDIRIERWTPREELLRFARLK